MRNGNPVSNVAAGVANFWLAGLAFWGAYAAGFTGAVVQGMKDAPQAMQDKARRDEQRELDEP